jgi:hypothetical protein
MCPAVLTHWLRPAIPPPPHLGSYTRALLVSQDRRHVTCLCDPLLTTYGKLVLRRMSLFNDAGWPKRCNSKVHKRENFLGSDIEFGTFYS